MINSDEVRPSGNRHYGPREALVQGSLYQPAFIVHRRESDGLFPRYARDGSFPRSRPTQQAQLRKRLRYRGLKLDISHLPRLGLAVRIQRCTNVQLYLIPLTRRREFDLRTPMLTGRAMDLECPMGSGLEHFDSTADRPYRNPSTRDSFHDGNCFAS